MARVDSESRKKEILRSAFECFTQFGYSKTSLDLIAQKMGISRPLIYLHFKDKEDLFASMLEDIFEEKYRLAEECLSSALPKKEKLLEFVEILILKDWQTLSASFNRFDFLSEIFQVLPKFEIKYRKKFIQMAATILADMELAEVFRFSLGGLTADNPTLPILRKRVKILINCFAK